MRFLTQRTLCNDAAGEHSGSAGAPPAVAGVPPGTSSRIQFKLETPCRALRAFGGTPNAAGVTPALPMRFNNQSK